MRGRERFTGGNTPPGRRTLAATALAFLIGCPASAPPPDAATDEPPVASPTHTAGPIARLEVLSRRSHSPYADYGSLGLSGENKPNGLEYRLRRSLPLETPAYMPRSLEGLELFIADPVREGWLAFYREPLERWEGPANPRFRAVLFGGEGERLWDLKLNRFLTRPDHLEIQDIRYSEGKLYFNEACQSYSREAEGRCSSVVRLDPRRGEVEWRTPPLTSNNIFLPYGPYIIAGYGFSGEPDHLYLIERNSGESVARQELDSAHSYLEVKDGQLVVVTYNSVYTLRLPDPGPHTLTSPPMSGAAPESPEAIFR